MSDVYVASDDQEPWCSLCSKAVPATIEVEEKTFVCEACLLDLIETLRRGMIGQSPETTIAELVIRVTYYQPGQRDDGSSYVTSKVNVSIETSLPAPAFENTSNTWTVWGDDDLHVPGTLLASSLLEEIVNTLSWWAAAAERAQLKHVATANGVPTPRQCLNTDPVSVVPMLLNAIGSIHMEAQQRLQCMEQSDPPAAPLPDGAKTYQR